MIPYTPSEEIANKNNTPIFRSHKTSPSPNGITDQLRSARRKVKIGATKKTTRLA